jgi:hypothetical protein
MGSLPIPRAPLTVNIKTEKLLPDHMDSEFHKNFCTQDSSTDSQSWIKGQASGTAAQSANKHHWNKSEKYAELLNKHLKNIGLKRHQIINLPGMPTCLGLFQINENLCTTTILLISACLYRTTLEFNINKLTQCIC